MVKMKVSLTYCVQSGEEPEGERQEQDGHTGLGKIRLPQLLVLHWLGKWVKMTV